MLPATAAPDELNVLKEQLIDELRILTMFILIFELIEATKPAVQLDVILEFSIIKLFMLQINANNTPANAPTYSVTYYQLIIIQTTIFAKSEEVPLMYPNTPIQLQNELFQNLQKVYSASICNTLRNHYHQETNNIPLLQKVSHCVLVSHCF
ncbi:Hypothetical_protein [Hexamita inflata]|uniref:Hypothetical_protein n=1 Tax=Hexamita inflata TaxID=28002 RepID=A0AA86NMT0_9EUKA|nr:Hypothetical protein HINF_LOCUS9518 [Hexamita inflata]CAI9964593.1 Hypothetical protein HINF_LOCUS52238 [Hexamita inflata]